MLEKKQRVVYNDIIEKMRIIMEDYKVITEIVKIIKNVCSTKEFTHKDKTNYERLLAKVDKSFIKRKQASVYWTNMVNAFDKEYFAKAIKHADKVITQIRPVANDRPFEINDKVAVIRHEHGWHDGRMEAIIKSKTKNSEGIWRYMAQVTSYENTQYDDNDYTIEIKHTRDAHLI